MHAQSAMYATIRRQNFKRVNNCNLLKLWNGHRFAFELSKGRSAPHEEQHAERQDDNLDDDCKVLRGQAVDDAFTDP